MTTQLSRRLFLARAAAASIALPGLSACAARGGSGAAAMQGRTLLRDPAGVFDVAPGLSYRVLARAGDLMSDGLRTPGAQDGMAAFPGADGRVRLVCNHELMHRRTVNGAGADATNDAFADDALARGLVDRARIYDFDPQGRPCAGGTTTMVLNPATGLVEESWLSLAGTLVNCAGGPTPWGSWLSCEEVVDELAAEVSRPHGFVFEVPSAHRGLVDPVPLTAMGRFKHEAVAVDPVSGVLYQTEDEHDLALFYRFLPDAPGELARGGRLQALGVKGAPGLDLRNWDSRALAQGETLETYWIDLDGVDNPHDDLTERGLAAGAAQFTRGEGCAMGAGEMFFTCTDGGPAKLGQVWRYTPTDSDNGALTLYLESTNPDVMERCDNIVVAPWGDLIVAEDGPGENRILGVRPDGGVYVIGSSNHEYMGEMSEVCGPCFSPDGSTLFFNIQRPGLTLAVTGDWRAARTV